MNARKLKYGFVGVYLLTSSLALADAPSPPPAASQPTKRDEPRIAKVRISPAAAPEPALKYLLMPGFVNQTSGNADALLSLAAELASNVKEEPTFEKTTEWLDLPADKLPRDQVLKTLEQFKDALHYAQLASRREYCEWDIPTRSEGVRVLLPALASQRKLSKFLALRIRLEICDGRYDDALTDLQTGFALGRYNGAGATLIHHLVGVAIGSLMAQELRQWVDKPNSPNLYWALAALPRPFIDPRRGLEFERGWILVEFPELRTLRAAVLTPQQADALVDHLVKFQQQYCSDNPRAIGEPWKSNEAAAATVKEGYAAARKALLAAGYTEEKVKAMPQAQVVILRCLTEFEHLRDGYFRWLGLPYWQVEGGMMNAERQIERAYAESKDRNPFIGLIPSIARARFLVSRLDRDIAALQCIEAIRMYAAAHASKLPPTLDDIKEAPVPFDSITGKPFVYEFHGDQATLARPKSSDNLRYELTVAK